MTSQTVAGSQPAGTTTPSADATPEAVATQLISLLDQFEGLVPGFQPHEVSDVHRVASAARFANELIQPTITAVSSFAPASERKLFDTDRGKAALAYRDALRPVAQRLSVLLDGVEFTIDSQLAEAGTEALQAYAWAKAYAKGPDGAGLRPYVDEMQRVVKKAINHRKPVATPPAPTPATAPKPVMQGFLAPNMVPGRTGEPDDLPENFRKALDEADQ